mmetsp:Transcript_45776/g.82880  ORF Transcript_45776/g.82880 Transcript_45776/m.82880 type:complete len:393 (+) Transcript_45776:45-1223(+)
MNTDVLRAALLYVGLLFILGWRAIAPWRPGHTFNKQVNYCTVLYYMMGVIYLMDLFLFVWAAARDFRDTPKDRPSTMGWPIIWLRTLVIVTPVVVLVILAFCFRQSMKHIDNISNSIAITAHDRALNIIALPAFYAVMTLSALVIVYSLVTQDATEKGYAWDMTQATAFGRYETCFYVADLYEAWALYQFGLLTIEQLEATVREKEEERKKIDSSPGPSNVMHFEAMSSVILVGTYLFVVTTFLQSAVSLYMWFFTDTSAQWENYENTMSQFRYAGMVASAAAIYNVHVVESTFHEYLADYFPFTKFLSVKLLVFFAFWQKPVFLGLELIGIIRLTDVQVKLLQAALMVFECALGAAMHWWAWDPNEAWYTDKVDKGERQPLLSSSTNPFAQ